MLRAVFGLSIIAVAVATGQRTDPSTTFEVASVKTWERPTPEPGRTITFGGIRGGPGTPDPGQITGTGVTIKALVMWAYDVRPYQVQCPGWMDSERYEVMAKVAQATTKAQARIMMQNLLAERFKVALHKDSKEMTIYELVLGKNGPKLKETSEPEAVLPKSGEAAPPPPPPPPPPGPGQRPAMDENGFPVLPRGSGRGRSTIMFSSGRAKMTALGWTMENFASMLSGQLDKPVRDMTGLKAAYDINFEFDPPNMGVRLIGGPSGPPPRPVAGDAGSGDASEPSTSPNIFDAVQKQLGLRLESKKSLIEIVVIDRAEKVPVEN